jgi:SAM-dependent methyltransferase
MASMTEPQGRPLAGFDAATYGDRFADVYDDWYADVTDTAACVATVADLARTAAAPAGVVGTGGGDADVNDGDDGDDGDRPRVLELGVGTGRLAIPLAEGGMEVTGVDASATMLAALATKPGGVAVRPVRGDMADLPTDHPALADRLFHVVLIAYNTLFNLVDDGAQQRCLERAAALVHPAGSVVVEAFVPDPGASSGDSVTTRQVTTDRVVLSVSRTDAAARLVVGQYVDISEAGVRLRPWQVRWTSPEGLDALATAAGLIRRHRWADWERTPFTADATTHVSVYRRS